MSDINEVSQTNIKYPEFGQPIDNPFAFNRKQIALRVAGASLGIIATATIGVTCGLTAGLGVAGIIMLSVTVSYVAKKIFFAYKSHQYRLAFDPATNNTYAPKLGSYSKVDLRVSNHATESFEWKKTLIASAKHSIELSANFAGGKDFREVLEMIENRMQLFSDLKCHLILSPDLLEDQDLAYLKNLKENYPNFNYLISKRVYTISPDFLSEENHVKMLVVDGQYFAMGGTGIHEKMTREESHLSSSPDSFGAKFIDKGFRDTDIIGSGRSAQTMRNQFFNLYRIWEYRMTGETVDRFFETEPEKAGICSPFHDETGLIKNVNLKYVVSGPEHRRQNPISSEIAHLASKAQSDIRIANLLFNPDNIVSDSLIDARNRKVSIAGYFNGTSRNSSSAHYIYALPNRLNYDLLDDAFEYGQKDQLYHKKVMTLDSQYTVVGSFNLGIKSAKCDYESVCVIDDPRVAKIMNLALDDDAAASKLLTDHKLVSKRRWSQIPSLITIGILGNFFG